MRPMIWNVIHGHRCEILMLEFSVTAERKFARAAHARRWTIGRSLILTWCVDDDGVVAATLAHPGRVSLCTRSIAAALVVAATRGDVVQVGHRLLARRHGALIKHRDGAGSGGLAVLGVADARSAR